MAEKRTLARPYAKAVFEIAQETQTFEPWSIVLSTLSLVSQNEAVMALLKDEKHDLEQIIWFFSEFCQKTVETTSLQNFIRILALKNRLSILPEIESLYQEMRNKAEKIIPVQITAATALNTAQQEIIKKRLMDYFQCSLKMDFAIDPQLLGGFVAKTGNYVIDSSVQGFLGNLKMAMGEQQ